jgi:hypothetical protein
MRVTSFLVALVILTPFFAFGLPDCSSLPLQATPCVVRPPEYWSVSTYVGHFALVSVVFWVMVRLRILLLNRKP